MEESRRRVALDDVVGALRSMAERSVARLGEDDSLNVFVRRHATRSGRTRPETANGAAPPMRWGRVTFHRINSETGSALVSFNAPDTSESRIKRHCRIVDPRLGQPRDPYTVAHAERAPLDVLYRVIEGHGGSARVEITRPR